MERLAGSRLMAAYSPQFDPEIEDIANDIARCSDQTATRFFHQTLSESIIDVKFLAAALLLLNATNFTALEDGPDLTKINIRRARKGQPELMGYRILMIRPSHAQAARGSDGSGKHKRFHHCRGHFKRRRTASGDIRLFWWSDHWRGDAKLGKVRKTYQI